MLAIVTAIAVRWQGRELRARLRLAPTRASVAGLGAAVFGMAALSLACGAARDLLGLSGVGTMAAIASALERPSPAKLVVGLVTIAITPAIAEEALFRGLLQTPLTVRWGRWPAIVVTALGFGLAHFDFVQGTVAFVAGLFLGWVVERFGGIRPAIAAHALNNAAFVLLASFGSPGVGSRAENVLLLAAGSLVSIGSIAVLRSHLAVTG
jgi:membrane protease YdiL (CAAX protease family)